VGVGGGGTHRNLKRKKEKEEKTSPPSSSSCCLRKRKKSVRRRAKWFVVRRGCLNLELGGREPTSRPPLPWFSLSVCVCISLRFKKKKNLISVYNTDTHTNFLLFKKKIKFDNIPVFFSCVFFFLLLFHFGQSKKTGHNVSQSSIHDWHFFRMIHFDNNKQFN
jgi:hypothetical protein